MSGPAFEDPRHVLRRHGLHAKKRYSQNFLVSQHAVDAIAAALAPRADEPVVELGPGLGTLTAALLRAGAREVLVVESDPEMRAVLAAELGVLARVIAEDATSLDWRAIVRERKEGGTRAAIVGNLPYAVTGQILRGLIGGRDVISRAVIMVQREVRDRLLARPGTREWGALTVFTQAAFEVEPVMLVPAGAFFPVPKVTSAVVRLVPRDVPLAEETDAFRKVVRAIFDARRKTLRNALRGAGLAADAMLAAAGIDPRRRGETLTIAELGSLTAHSSA